MPRALPPPTLAAVPRGAEAAVADERVLIAGELHDVVAHAVTAMTIQAGAARRLAARDAERARAALATAEGTGREALTELRRLLALLRRADEDVAPAAERTIARAAERAGRAAAVSLTTHDVVAHAVATMVVQAGGARRILDRDPARAMAAADVIERTGRAALAGMRALLAVLRADEHVQYAPQPTLLELEALVERTRGAGVAVTLAVDGARRALPAGLDLAAYRVVQEALANVLRHAGGAPAEVEVHYRGDAVEVRIADRGAGARDARLDGGGHGLLGMRERVRMCGGDLHAGRRRGGGFEVSARLPLEGEEDAALTAGARA